MDQRRFFIAVRHPLARAASLTPPQLPLGDETLGNTKPWGNQLQGQRTQKTLGQTAPRTKTSGQPAPRKKTLGQPDPSTKKQKKHPTFKGAVTPRKKTSGQPAPRKKMKTTPNLQGYGQNKNKNNAQYSRVRSKQK